MAIYFIISKFVSVFSGGQEIFDKSVDSLRSFLLNPVAHLMMMMMAMVMMMMMMVMVMIMTMTMVRDYDGNGDDYDDDVPSG